VKQYLVRAKPQRTAPCGGPPSFSFLFYNRPHSITLQVTDEIGFCFTILFHYWQAQRTRITSTHCPLRRASEPFFLINAPIISSCRWLPWFVFPYPLSLLAGTTYKNYLNALPLAEGLRPIFFNKRPHYIILQVTAMICVSIFSFTIGRHHLQELPQCIASCRGSP